MKFSIFFLSLLSKNDYYVTQSVFSVLTVSMSGNISIGNKDELIPRYPASAVYNA